MSQQYTNELTPQILSTMDTSPFTPEQLAEMRDEALALINAQDDYARQHPVVAIWRHATKGSLTRNGGGGFISQL